MDKDLENIEKRMRSAGRILKLTAAQLKKLTTPEHIWTAKLPLKLENGKWRNLLAWRVQHSRVRGPYKGGIRFHPAVNLDLIKSLALEMALKTAVVGLPMGGSKGGIAVDPKKLTEQELEELSRSYVHSFHRYLGPYRDIPAPDVGTNEKVMAWMVSEFAKQTQNQKSKGKSQEFTEREILATFTGKPVELGGSAGRREATGRGGLVVLEKMLHARPIPQPFGLTEKPEGFFLGRAALTVAVQGLGNVGGVFARLAAQSGFKVVAVGDSRGGVTAKVKSIKYKVRSKKSEATTFEKLDIGKVLKWKEEKGTLAGLPGTRTITNEELLELPVDILVPSALGNVITAKNAGKIKAKIILELANGPTTLEAEKILRNKGMMVIPDILANAGGVTVSYFEWRQNLAGQHWTEDKVNQELARVMKKAVADVLAMQRRHKVDLRTAAYLLALKRLTMDKHLMSRRTAFRGGEGR